MSRRRTTLLGNPDAVHGFARDDHRIRGMNKSAMGKKLERESEILDINENAIKNELGLLSKAGTMFRAKLIEQFQLVHRIGSIDSSANYLSAQYTLSDVQNKMDEVMMTNPNAQVKLPSLRIKRRNATTFVDGFRRQRNRANLKYREKVLPPFNEWAYWVLASRSYHIMIQVAIVIHLLVNNLFVEYAMDEMPNLKPSNNETIALPEESDLNLSALSVVEYITTMALVADILLKWVYDFQGYWYTILNVLDVVVVPISSPLLISLIKLIYPSSTERKAGEITTLDRIRFFTRMLRLLLTIKFALTFEGCRLTLVLIKKTLRRLIKAIYIFLLAMVSFGAFAIVAFDDGSGQITWYPHDLQLHTAALTFTFQMFTGDRWYDWYKKFTKVTVVSKPVVAIYIVTWIVVSDFLLGNLFIALLTLNFQEIRSKLMEQMEQLKQKKRASIQLDLLNEELRQHSSEMLITSGLDQHTQEPSLEHITSLIEQEWSYPLMLPDSKDIMAALKEAHQPKLRTTYNLPTLQPVAESSEESYESIKVGVPVHKTMTAIKSRVTDSLGVQDSDSDLAEELGTAISMQRDGPDSVDTGENSYEGMIPTRDNLSPESANLILPPETNTVEMSPSTSLSVPPESKALEIPLRVTLSLPSGTKAMDAPWVASSLVPHGTNDMEIPPRATSSLPSGTKAMDASATPNDGVPAASSAPVPTGESAVVPPVIPMIQLPSEHSVAESLEELTPRQLQPLPSFHSHFLAKSEATLKSTSPQKVSELGAQGSTTYIDHLNAKHNQGNPRSRTRAHNDTSIYNSNHHHGSDYEQCRLMNHQVRNTLRWNKNVHLNMETLQSLYTVFTYPEDTLLSYLVLLGDLVENMKERQILLQQLNHCLIDFTDNKDDLERSDGTNLVADDDWLKEQFTDKPDHTQKPVNRSRVPQAKNFMQLIRDLIQQNKKDNLDPHADEYGSVINRQRKSEADSTVCTGIYKEVQLS